MECPHDNASRHFLNYHYYRNLSNKEKGPMKEETASSFGLAPGPQNLRTGPAYE
jgi:hypothetical protein